MRLNAFRLCDSSEHARNIIEVDANGLWRIPRSDCFPRTGPPIPTGTRRGESVSAETTRAICRPQEETPSGNGFHPFTLAQLSRFFEWKDAVTIVKPDTLIRWHRKGFRLFWKWKSRPGRPAVPVAVRKFLRSTGE
jgi:hypothetical protein